MEPIASLLAVIDADASGFTASLAASESGLRRFAGNVQQQTAGAAATFAGNLDKMSAAAGTLSSLGGGLTAGLTLPLAGLGLASVKAAGDIQALEKGFAATYKGSEPLQDALIKVRELAKLPGLGLKEALQGATNLQAAGFSANLAARSLAAFGNALATVGKGKADLDGVGLALGQIASKGKISAEEINQLSERLPQLRGALQAAFGTSDAEALNKAGISATDFVEKVTAELEKLPKVTGGINNAFENLSDSASKSLTKLGDALSRSLNIEGNTERLGNFLEGLAGSFAALPESTQDTIFALGGLALAVGPVIAGLGAIGAAIPTIVAGLGTVGAAVGLAAGPLALLVVGVGAAAVAIVTHWDDIVSYFNGPDGQVFRELGRSVGESIDQIKAAFADLNSSSNFGDLVSASGIVGIAVKEIGTGITSILDTINGLVRTTSALLQGDWARAWDGAKQVVNGLLGPLANLFGLDYAGLRDKLNILGDTPKEGASILTNQFIALNKGLAGYLAVAPVATAATNKLNEATAKTPALTETQIKALAKLNNALAQASDLSNALGQDSGVAAIGSEYDFVQAKIKALEGAIPGLVTAFGSQAQVVQRSVAELYRLKSAYDDLGKIDPPKLPVGFAEFKPFDIQVDVKVNPLDDKATREIQQQLARLGVETPVGGLDLTQFKASAAELQAIADKLKTLPDIGNISLRGPIDSIQELRDTLVTLTDLPIGPLPALTGLSGKEPLTNIEQVREEISRLTGIAVATLPPLEGLDVSLPIGSLQELKDALISLPQTAQLAPVGDLDVSKPLNSLDRLRVALASVQDANQLDLPAVTGVDTSAPLQNLEQLYAVLSQVSGIAVDELPDLSGLDPSIPLANIAQLAQALDQLPGAKEITVGVNTVSLDQVRAKLAEVTKLPAVDTTAFEGSINYATTTLTHLPTALSGLELPPLPPLPPFETTAFIGSLTDAQIQAINSQAKFNTDFEALVDGLGDRLGNLAADAASSLVEGLGQAFSGVASFGDAMGAAFATTLGLVTDFMKSFGKQLIALGVAKLLVDKFKFAPGPGLIAAGIALGAVATVISSTLSKGPLSGGASSGSTPSVSVAPNANQRQAPLIIDLRLQPVELRQKGPDMAGVLAYESYRQRRTG